jgi:hypothetical protein
MPLHFNQLSRHLTGRGLFQLTGDMTQQIGTIMMIWKEEI